MSASNFWTRLMQDGRTLVETAVPASGDDARSLSDVLARVEALYRDSLPSRAPAFDLKTATQAAISYYRACQCFVFREIDSIRSELQGLERSEPTAAAHYSVDFALRFLPGLVRRVQSAAKGDELLGVLDDWCLAWPLSAIGARRRRDDEWRAACSPGLTVVLNDDCLRRVLIDRILKTEDETFLTDDRVRSAVRAAIGNYPQLSPRIAARLQEADE